MATKYFNEFVSALKGSRDDLEWKKLMLLKNINAIVTSFEIIGQIWMLKGKLQARYRGKSSLL